MKKLICLISLISALGPCYGQTWQGTVTSGLGTFDYEINTITDKMVLSNPTGFFTTYGGFTPGSITMVPVVANPAAGMANLSLSDDASGALLFTGLDDSYMATGHSALAMVNGDGWFWVAEDSIVNSSAYADALLGANVINYEENGAAWDISYSFAYTGGGATNQLSPSEVSNPVLVPEPSTALLFGLACVVSLYHRRHR